MESCFTGYFECIDSYGRIVINHNETKLNHLPFWKWTNKLIGKPSPDFIGKKNGLALPADFIQGDEVKVHFKLVHCPKSTESNKRIVITKMELIG